MVPQLHYLSSEMDLKALIFMDVNFMLKHIQNNPHYILFRNSLD